MFPKQLQCGATLQTILNQNTTDVAEWFGFVCKYKQANAKKTSITIPRCYNHLNRKYKREGIPQKKEKNSFKLTLYDHRNARVNRNRVKRFILDNRSGRSKASKHISGQWRNSTPIVIKFFDFNLQGLGDLVSIKFTFTSVARHVFVYCVKLRLTRLHWFLNSLQ